MEAVVKGRVTQRGDPILVSPELIEVRSNRNLWGDQYDRKVSYALAVQQDISAAIASKLRERLGGGEAKKQVTKVEPHTLTSGQTSAVSIPRPDGASQPG